MELSANPIIGEDHEMATSPSDQQISIQTTPTNDTETSLGSPTLVSGKSSTISPTNPIKSLSNETLQKLQTDPTFYESLYQFFQNNQKAFLNSSTSSIHQLQHLSQKFTKHTGSDQVFIQNQLQTSSNQNSHVRSPTEFILQESLQVSPQVSSDESSIMSPAPSGLKTSSITPMASIPAILPKKKPHKSSDSKSNKNSHKKLKHKSSFTPHRSLSSSSSARSLYQQKIIFTPTFEHEKKISPSESITGDFDIVEAHKRLEILEDRIIAGKSKYLHPAYSVQLEQEELEKANGAPLELTPEEEILVNAYEKYANQDNQIPKQKIPRFWPKRSYDDPENLMDEIESDSLKTRIITFNESVFAVNSISSHRNNSHHCDNGTGEFNYYDLDDDDSYDDADSNDDFRNGSDIFDNDSDDDDQSGSYHYHLHGSPLTKNKKSPRNLKLQSGEYRMSTRAFKFTDFDKDVDDLFEPSSKKISSKKQMKKNNATVNSKQNKARIQKMTNSTSVVISNLFFETDDSGDETDAELF